MLPPEIASEVSARVHAQVPDLRHVFALQDLSMMTGAELERLLQAVFLMGYGEALGDQARALLGVASPILDWVPAL